MTIVTGPLVAQIAQPYRYELQQKNSDDYFNIISLKENGLALFRERDKFKQNNRLWELILLDSTLNEKKKVDLEIKERHKMVGYEIGNASLYFLFRTGDTNKNDFELIEISFDGDERERFSIKPDLDFRLTHFIKAGENFVFGGYVSNEAVIILFEPAGKSIRVLPGFFQKDTELVDLRTNQNGTFNTILMDRSNRGEKKILFRTFDPGGKQLLEDNILLDEDVTLQTAITSTLEREELIIAGTWGERNSKQSSGFFTLPVNPFADQKVSYVEFGELDNFVNYLNQKRAARIKANARDKSDSGRPPAFSAYVMPFRMVENKEGFYLLAEVYNPVSSNSYFSGNPYYYNPYFAPYGYSPYWNGFYYPAMSRMYRPHLYGPNSRSSNETKTLETVVLLLDENGKVKWDQSFKLDEVRLPALEQVGDFAVVGDSVYITYKKESDIHVKSAPLLGEGTAERSYKVRTLEDQDVIRSEKEFEGGIRHWYGKSFYVWGYQTIRNASKKDRVRDVFYINRVDP